MQESKTFFRNTDKVDLQVIRSIIFVNDLIPDVLEKMGCQHIKKCSNRFEAQLPGKFNSDNKRSVQVYNNEALPCKIRSRTLNNRLDIFDLISYIVFSIFDENQIKKNLPKSISWLSHHLNIDTSSYIKKNSPETDTIQSLKWLKDIVKKRTKPQEIIEQNPVYLENMLNAYLMYPVRHYIEESVDVHTQKEFEIGFDPDSMRIIFPIRNQQGHLISIKARTIDPKYELKQIPKYIYLIPFKKQLHLYNLHKALPFIRQLNKVIVFEGEKSCWLATQFGYAHCVAVGGSEISIQQAQLLQSLGLNTQIIIAFDKDKHPEEVVAQAKKIGPAYNVHVLTDQSNLLSAEKKHSPTDLGSAIFHQLINTDNYQPIFRFDRRDR